MTRVVEASPKVLVMRNPKTETKQQFMARAEKIADEQWVEPVAEQTTSEVVGEIVEQVSAVKAELDFLRWFHAQTETYLGEEFDLDVGEIQDNYPGVIPKHYREE